MRHGVNGVCRVCRWFVVEQLQGDAEGGARVLRGLMQVVAMQQEWILRSLWLELKVVKSYDSKTKAWVRKE